MTHLTGSFLGIGTNPTVTAIVPINEESVRIFYSTLMSSSVIFNSTSSYSIIPTGSVSLTAISISPEAATYPNYVDLLFDKEMTNGVSNYSLNLNSGIVDYLNQGITPLSYSFSGYGTPPYVDDVYIPTSINGSSSDNITFKLLDAFSTVNSSSINVQITQGTGSAQYAISGGAFVAPFNGAGSSLTSFETGYSIVIDPTSDLTFEVALTVTASDTSLNTLITSFLACEDNLLLPSRIIKV